MRELSFENERIMYGAQVIGLLDGCEFTVRFGPDLDEGIDREISLRASTSVCAGLTALALRLFQGWGDRRPGSERPQRRGSLT